MKPENKRIIVFSGKQFSGKDTVAKMILKRFAGFRRIGIADAIKLCYAEKTNLSVEEIEKNKSFYRPDLIALGNWGRAQNPDYWLNAIIDYEGNVIVPDVRMKHELDLFRSHNAFCIRVEASEAVRAERGVLSSKDDETETLLDNVSDWDYVITNEGSLSELEKETDKLIVRLEKFIKD